MASVVAILWLTIGASTLSVVSANDNEANNVSSSLAKTPASYNCEPLTAAFQVRWKVDETNSTNEKMIDIELIGKVPDNGYMAFGVSGEPDEPEMIGSDVVVADFFGGNPRAVDYNIDGFRECDLSASLAGGVCPDGALPNDTLTNDIDVNTVTGERASDGLTLIRYRRPAIPTDINAQRVTNVATDHAINVTSQAFTSVIWALGLVDTDTGYPQFHSIGYLNSLLQIEFGRTVVDNCEPLIQEEQGGVVDGGDGEQYGNSSSIVDVNCDNFGSSPYQVTDKLTLNAIVDPVQNTLTAELTYNGLAWIAIAFTNGQPHMVGAEAVIGMPNEANGEQVSPMKYNLYAETEEGVKPMPADQQTLTNSTITQKDGKTILKFTKKLMEDGEHSIFADQKNVFLFAHGSSNSLGLHTSFGDFELLPNQCAVYRDGVLQNEQALNQQGQEAGGTGGEVDTNRELWVAHGVCAAVAWGILVPLAIGASLIRNILIKIGLPPSAWFNVHRGLNMLAAVLTLISFTIAVKAINNEPNADHFDASTDKHPLTGLIIFILTMSQAIGGILRPHHHPANNDKEQDKEGEADKTNANSVDEDTRSRGNSNNNNDGLQDHQEKSTIRWVWEIIHRVFGLALLGFAWWQVQDGLHIFSELFQEENLDQLFLIMVSCLSGAIVLLALVARLPSCQE